YVQAVHKRHMEMLYSMHDLYPSDIVNKMDNWFIHVSLPEIIYFKITGKNNDIFAFYNKETYTITYGDIEPDEINGKSYDTLTIKANKSINIKSMIEQVIVDKQKIKEIY